MKIVIYGDPHWSQYSSIVRKRGKKYSARLENLIDSMNWVMELAERSGCWATFCLGDFFDRAELNAEEISALKEIKWAPMSNYFIAGNHEMAMNDHTYTSAKVFDLLDTGEVITEPTTIRFDNVEFCILPYILEGNRRPITEYFNEERMKDSFGLKIPRVILSHNDVAGIPMGQFISKEGFDIEEIESNCDLFINGHLHNGGKITDKIINCGNLTGQNFSEDAMHYDHVALLLDLDTLKCEVYENPYALNFYKIDTTHWHHLGDLQVKSNAVCTVKCKERDAEVVRKWIDETYNIIESRLIIEPEIKVSTEDVVEAFSVDHIEKFREYILKTLVEEGSYSSDVVNAELLEISK